MPRAGQFIPLAFDRAEWMADGACRGSDPAAWFPPRGGSVAPLIRTCMGCPVREECAEYAIRNNIKDGVWGGLSARERRGQSAKRRSWETRALQPCGTPAAYKRHLRRKEPACDACKAATSAYSALKDRQRRAS